MSWELGLEDRGVLVTGAAGGIGRSVAAAFAGAGARVAAMDLDLTSSEHVVAELEAPDRHLALGGDWAASRSRMSWPASSSFSPPSRRVTSPARRST